MRARHRHFTLANSGASACWDSRPLTQSDGASITSWADRISSRAADRATNSPVVKVAIQGGQPIIRFESTAKSLDTASNSLTADKGAIMIISVAASTVANTSGYQQIVRSLAGATNDRCALYLRSSKVEAGGRRLDANSYQFVQSGTASNNTFTIASAFFDYANAQLYAYERGTQAARSGGFQNSGNTSNTNSPIQIGDSGGNGIQRLLGDIGMCVLLESSSSSLRKRFEHAAAYSFKISCN